MQKYEFIRHLRDQHYLYQGQYWKLKGEGSISEIVFHEEDLRCTESDCESNEENMIELQISQITVFIDNNKVERTR
jgi:hypothetical protein